MISIQFSIWIPPMLYSTLPETIFFMAHQEDMVVQPIEKVISKDWFILEVREKFWIDRYGSVKTQTVEVVEHGLNQKWILQVAVYAIISLIALAFSECLLHQYKRFCEFGPAVPMLLATAVCCYSFQLSDLKMVFVYTEIYITLIFNYMCSLHWLTNSFGLRCQPS